MPDRKWKEIVVDTNNDVWDREEPIEGKFVKTETEIGPKKSNLYTIKTDKGEIKVWGSTVLDDKLVGVPKGAYIKIEYTGKERSKSGNEYHTYKVFIDADMEDRGDDSGKDEVFEDDKVNLDEIFPE